MAIGAVNATQLWNSTEYLGLINNINAYSGGLLINSILIVIALITFYAMKNFETGTAITASMVVTGMFCLLFAGTGLGGGGYAAAGLALLVAAFLYSVRE